MGGQSWGTGWAHSKCSWEPYTHPSCTFTLKCRCLPPSEQCLRTDLCPFPASHPTDPTPLRSGGAWGLHCPLSREARVATHLPFMGTQGPCPPSGEIWIPIPSLLRYPGTPPPSVPGSIPLSPGASRVPTPLMWGSLGSPLSLWPTSCHAGRQFLPVELLHAQGGGVHQPVAGSAHRA